MFFRTCLKTLYPQLGLTNEIEQFRLHDGTHSDFTFNQIIPLSRILSKDPNEILSEIKTELDNHRDVETKISQNKLLISYTLHYLETQVNHLLFDYLQDEILHSPKKEKQKILIDFSSVNISKEMHVGHLRSTIIGESLCRLFEHLGDEVLRINHVGDWGTQFGMLIHYLKTKIFINNKEEKILEDICELNRMYKESKKLFDDNEEFQEGSRKETYKLQKGDPENLMIWKKLCEVSMNYFNKIYEILGTHSEIKGESFYQPFMEKLVKELDEQGKVENHEGMKIIHSSKKEKAANENTHLILIKSDGAFTYDTSDLAALHYRVTVERANKILYVVDLGQETHFNTLFDVYHDLHPSFSGGIYVGFGQVLGKDGKRLKTRSGETVKLIGLIEEAYEHARKVTKEISKNKFSEDKLETISKKIAINCIKYADLSNPRTSSYKYDAAKMMNTKGNTAVYLMYAMARCKSILRKVDSFCSSKLSPSVNFQEQIIKIENLEGRNLVALILKYPETLLKAAETYSPHILCNYLYNLVNILTKFYEKNRCIEFDNSKACHSDENKIISIYYHRINLLRLALAVTSLMFKLISLEEVDEL